MNPYGFTPEELRALAVLARNKIREDNAPLLETIVVFIIALAFIVAFAFGIITTIIVLSNLELFGNVNITG